jgi:hypothetical protein
MILANGAPIEKIRSARADSHQNGARGAIAARVFEAKRLVAYYVYWNDRPGVPVLVPAELVRAARARRRAREPVRRSSARRRRSSRRS